MREALVEGERGLDEVFFVGGVEDAAGFRQVEIAAGQGGAVSARAVWQKGHAITIGGLGRALLQPR